MPGNGMLVFFYLAMVKKRQTAGRTSTTMINRVKNWQLANQSNAAQAGLIGVNTLYHKAKNKLTAKKTKTTKNTYTQKKKRNRRERKKHGYLNAWLESMEHFYKIQNSAHTLVVVTKNGDLCNNLLNMWMW